MTYKLYDFEGNFFGETSTFSNIQHNGIVIDDDSGDIFYRKKNCFHREDGPAIEWASGAKEWYVNGHQHRIGGPADEWSEGVCKRWYINGKPVTELEHDLLFNIMKLKGLI